MIEREPSEKIGIAERPRSIIGDPCDFAGGSGMAPQIRRREARRA
jgi:hypothetical protein